MFDGNPARFKVDGLPSEDVNGNRGVVVVNGATVTLQIEVIPSSALSATFQLFDAAAPSSPLASLSAPVVNFTGSGTASELLTDPDTQTSTFTFPATGIEAYLVRCTVATSEGPKVFERMVVSRGLSSALRKTVPAESQEFESRGWSDELNRMVDAVEAATFGLSGTIQTTLDIVATIGSFQTVDDDRTISISGVVIARRADGAGKLFKFSSLCRRETGEATTVVDSTDIQNGPQESEVLTWNIVVTATAGGLIQVQGDPGEATTINWSVQADVQEI